LYWFDVRPGSHTAFLSGSVRLSGRSGAIRNPLEVRVCRVRAHRIDELELMLDHPAVVHMLKEIVDAFLLHEAAHEVKVRLPVLNAMIHLAVSSCQRKCHIVEAM